MVKNLYETPTIEEIEIKVEDVMAESIEGEGSITDSELFG
jgi:hypothetical protein